MCNKRHLMRMWLDLVPVITFHSRTGCSFLCSVYIFFLSRLCFSLRTILFSIFLVSLSRKFSKSFLFSTHSNSFAWHQYNVSDCWSVVSLKVSLSLHLFAFSLARPCFNSLPLTSLSLFTFFTPLFIHNAFSSHQGLS